MNKPFFFIALGVVALGTWLLLADKPAQVPTVDDEATQVMKAEMPRDNAEMTFFITSENPGEGANLGGLEGADAYCQSLATTVGAGDYTWRAYLSTAQNGTVIDARDRIGSGPWQNADGTVIAQSVADLHSNNTITKETALTEAGEMVNGRGDEPNSHDILTGSQPDGTALVTDDDTTCNDWTSGTEGAAIVGHHDRVGLADDDASKSWNSSHGSRGCSLEALAVSGGAGLFYCFAAE